MIGGIGMKNIVNDYVEKFQKHHKNYKKYMMVFAVLAVVTVIGVNWQLHQTGISMTADYQCGLEEHTHTEDCYTKELTCGQAESDEEGGHHHTEDCYTEELTCGKTEHTHTTECLIDTTADVETAEDWEATLPELSGEWADDMAAVAKSQLGYQESTKNFKIDDDGETTRGYTRYGDWAGDKYAAWSVPFAEFCMYYSGVPSDEVPRYTTCAEWMAELDNQGLYEAAEKHEPQTGDLLFADEDGDGSADHVGVVTAVSSSGDVTVVEGDSSNKVAEQTYSAQDAKMVGYAALAVNASGSDKAATQKKGGGGGSSGGTTTEDTSGTATVSKAPDYIGTINTANQWQIVAEQYKDNSYDSQKKVDTNNDGVNDLLYQKNVVPTGVENEFLVYLSVSKQMTWDEILAESRFAITTSNHYHEGNYSIGEDVGTLNSGNAIKDVIKGSPSVIEPGESGSRNYHVTVNYTRNGTVVHTYNGYYHGTTPNCENGTGFILFKMGSSEKVVLASQTVNLAKNSTELSFTIELDKMEAQGFNYLIDPIKLNSVTDQMGDYIKYDSVVKCDGTYNFADPTLTWTPQDHEGVDGENGTYDGKTTGYHFNISQMVYKVKLDVTKTGFNSCADNMKSTVNDEESYPVNNYATLSYTVDNVPGTEKFPVPYVRGLLYDVTFSKQNGNGNNLSGAKFALYEEGSDTPVTNVDGEECVLTTNKDTAVNRFANLPWGDYVLKEIGVPKGYTASQTSWDMTLCYTINSDSVTKDSSPYAMNMRWIGNGSSWVITNERAKDYAEYSILVNKVDQNGNPLEGVTFELTPVIEGTEATQTTDANGQISFGDGFTASDDIELTLTETETPKGYYSLPTAIKFKVQKSNDDSDATATLVNSDELNNAVTLELTPTTNSDGDTVYALTITVQNTQGVVLPETGGHGTLWITLGGLLVAAGALMYGYRRRRKQERGNC